MDLPCAASGTDGSNLSPFFTVYSTMQTYCIRLSGLIIDVGCGTPPQRMRLGIMKFWNNIYSIRIESL